MTRLGNHTDLCDKIGIRHTQGWTPEQAIDLHSPPETYDEICVAGKIYPSMADACFAHGVYDTVVKARLDRGWTIEQAFELETAPPGAHAVEHEGRSYKSLEELAADFGISANHLRRRIYDGWTMDQALEIVDRPNFKVGLYSQKYFDRYPELRSERSGLYLLAITDLVGGDEFYKIGISLNAKARAAAISAFGYAVEIVTDIVLDLYSAWQLEQMLFEEYANQRFAPERAVFGGRTECFRFTASEVEDAVDLIEGFSNESS